MVPLSAEVDGSAFPITVAVTHLDHISEPERRTQLGHVVRALGDSEQLGGSTVLMGDLNAMTRSDYTEDEWAAHEKRNADAGWDAPATGAYDNQECMLAPAGTGHHSVMFVLFVLGATCSGCLRILEEAGFVDAFAKSALSKHKSPASTGLAEVDRLWRWTGHVDEPIYRIDYIWTKTAATGVHLAVAGSFVATDVTHSDHYPVVADFDVPSTATKAARAQSVSTMKSDL
jgi:endonuclease/exonuclease/phosphatase family metal-dependent hydrolase